jgi:hypothetical protein
MMDNNNIIAFNDANEWLVRNGYDYQTSYQSTNGKTYFEYKSNAGLIYRLPSKMDFSIAEQELFRNYIKGNIKMKTTFTLQDLQSIPKQKWLDYIEKHATQDVIDDMYEWHESHGKSDEYRELDGYRLAPRGFGILILSFLGEKILSDKTNKHFRNNDEYVFEDIMQDLNTLVRHIFRLKLDNPLLIANKVVEMLNELMNS